MKNVLNLIKMKSLSMTCIKCTIEQLLKAFYFTNTPSILLSAHICFIRHSWYNHLDTIGMPYIVLIIIIEDNCSQLIQYEYLRNWWHIYSANVSLISSFCFQSLDVHGDWNITKYFNHISSHNVQKDRGGYFSH